MEVIWFHWENNGNFSGLNLWNFLHRGGFLWGFWCLPNLPHPCLRCLSPHFLLPRSPGEVRQPDLKPTFLLHEMLMSSRCEIKMLWLSFWHMRTGLWGSANLRPAEIYSRKSSNSVGIRSSQSGVLGCVNVIVDLGMRRPAIRCCADCRSTF